MENKPKMEMFSNMLGLGTPKTPKDKIDLPSGSQSKATSRAASVACSVAGSVYSLTRKLSDAAENAMRAAEETLAREEANAERLAAARRAERKKEDDAWDALTEEKQKEVIEEVRRRDGAEALTFPKPKPDKSPDTPTDDDLVELQRLETERMIAKLQ